MLHHFRLRCYNTIRYTFSTASSPKETIIKHDLNVLYCDNHIIVVNKPPGILSQGDKTNDISILDDIKAYIKEKYKKPGDVYLGLVHRLDRPCSGVMVFARNSKAAARLCEGFRDRMIDKKYVCVVNGALSGAETLSHHIIRTHKNRIKVVESQDKIKDADISTLHYQSILTLTPKLSTSSLSSSPLPSSIKPSSSSSSSPSSSIQSLIQIMLVTGRKHQIRSQLAHIGHPIVGDKKYGASQGFASRDISLHSYSLTIQHPATQQMMLFTSPAPSSWMKRFGPEVHHAIDAMIIEAHDSHNNDSSR